MPDQSLYAQGQTLAGAPNPPPPLSGLLFGNDMGFSGASAGDMGGSLIGGGKPGMPPGPGLDILSLLAQLTQGGDGGVSAGVSPLSLGQQQGGFGAGALGQQGGIQSPFFQTVGQQGVAGQTTDQAQRGQGTSGDLLGLIKQLLSVGQKGADLFQAFQTPEAAAGNTSGVSLSDQVRSGVQAPAQGGIASPTVDNISGLPGTDPFPGMPADILGALGAGPSFRPDILSPEVQQLLGSQIFGDEFGGYGTPDLGGGGGGGGPDTGFGAGDLSGILGLLRSGAGLGQGIQQGDPSSILQNLYGLYSQSAPALSSALGQELPTVGSALGGLVPDFAAAFPASAGAGAGSATGAGASFAGNLAAAGGGAAGGAVLGAGLSAMAYPYIQAIMNGVSQMFGMGFSEQEQNQLMNQMREIRGIQKDFGTVSEVLRGAADLPQRAAPALAGTDPTALADIVRQAVYAVNQGPALSRAYSQSKAGPFRSGIPSSVPWIDQAFSGAVDTYLQAMTRLQQLGSITEVPGAPVAGPGPFLEGYGEGAPTPASYWAGGQRLPWLATPGQFTNTANPQILQQYAQLLAPYFPKEP